MIMRLTDGAYHGPSSRSQASEDIETLKEDTEAQQSGVAASNGNAKETPAHSLPPPPRQTPTRELPRRPGPGMLGKQVQLLANYVPLKLDQDLVFYRYHIEITRVDSTKSQQCNPSTAATSQLAAQFADNMAMSLNPGGASKVSGPEAQSAKVVKKAAGMKRAHVIVCLLGAVKELKTLDEKGALASDFRDNLITTVELDGGIHNVTYCGVRSDYRVENYRVALRKPDKGPLQLKMGDLLDYLRTGNDSNPAADQEGLFSQVLNIWLRHFSKYQEALETAAQTVVGSKAYPLLQDATTPLVSGIETIRGYFSSIRFGEARAWVNVNITHGAFFQSSPLKQWVRDAGLNHAELHEVLKGVRVRLTHRRAQVDNTEKDIIKVISGLATPMDGVPERQLRPPHAPQVPKNAPAHGATCELVLFYDMDKKRHVSVFEHFSKSESACK
jgi:hypothetical protein